MRRSVIAIAALVVVLMLAVMPAGAITYGEPDGNGHPNVGALIAEWRVPGVKEEFCSGTLIAPTVFLTASHCTASLQSRGIPDNQVWVSFDQDVDPVTPTTTLIQGTMHTHPEFGFSGPGGFSDPHDIAVIVLDVHAASVYPGIQPAALPTEGLFDQLAKKNGLKGQRFTAVGYGTHQPEIGGGPPTFPFDGKRWRSVSEFDALNSSWLRLSQNNATGDGGTCFGDSGVVAGITVTGDAMCLATNVIYRLDTLSARAFLGPFVSLP